MHSSRTRLHYNGCYHHRFGSSRHSLRTGAAIALRERCHRAARSIASPTAASWSARTRGACRPLRWPSRLPTPLRPLRLGPFPEGCSLRRWAEPLSLRPSGLCSLHVSYLHLHLMYMYSNIFFTWESRRKYAMLKCLLIFSKPITYEIVFSMFMNSDVVLLYLYGIFRIF